MEHLDVTRRGVVTLIGWEGLIAEYSCLTNLRAAARSVCPCTERRREAERDDRRNNDVGSEMEPHVLSLVQKFHDFEPGQIHSRAAADRNLVSGFGLAFNPDRLNG
jgi:hypothetical protein